MSQHRAVDLQRPQHTVRRIVGFVPETPKRLEHAALVKDGKGRRVDAQFVPHGGEDRVGHLGRVGRRREGAGHGLHALRRLGGDAPPPLVPGLGPGRPQLHVALPAQVGDPHRHGGRRQHCDDAQRVIQLAIVVGRRADDECEECGHDADERHAGGAGEGRGDEGRKGEQPHERDVPPRDGEDDRHGGGPRQRDERRNGLGTIAAGRPRGGRKLVLAWFGHVVSPGSAGSSLKRYSPGRVTRVNARRSPGL